MNHVIKQQQLFLSIDERLDAFKVQHLASQYYWHTILPALEILFNNISNEDEIIELERLEIDLGPIMEKSISRNEWTKKLQIKLEKNFTELLSVSLSGKDAVRKPKPLSICAQWLFYMRYGYIPWNTINIDEQWYKNVLEVLAGDYETVTVLRNIIINDATATWRIIFQHTESFLVHLVEILTAQSQENLPVIFNELYELFGFMGKQNISFNPGDEKVFKRKLWKAALNIAATQAKDLTPAALSKKIITSYLNESLILHPIPIELTLKLKTVSAILSELKNDLDRKKNKQPDEIHTIKKELGKEKPIKQDEPLTQTKKEEGYDQLNRDKDKIDATKKTDDFSNQHNLSEKFNDDLKHAREPMQEPGAKDLFEVPLSGNKEFDLKVVDEDGIFVHNAGIVLIHPFLTNLFRRLQLIKENNFTGLYAWQKALQLLCYLGTANTVAEEYELVIPKLLCNYSLKEPVPMEINLTANELTEAEDMLMAAILQWDKIKNTSIGAFRESFLQRKGKLFRKKNALHLQVETHAIDVLLDYLPWNLSIIKLPWMKEMLHVEWR